MPVCIAGMHRSGTSMVTQYLHQCGLYLGPDRDIMPPAEENPEGFWENIHFVELSEEILNQMGGGWDCPPPEPKSWHSPRLAPYRTAAETTLEHFAGKEPWGWKDPRASLTLPFWQTIIDGLKVIIVVRNPLEVALSLRKRNGFSFALGLTLWQITNRRLLDAAASDDRLVTHYEAYFADPEAEIRRLLIFLEMPVDDELIASFRDTASPSLRHHRLTTQELIAADVSRDIYTLYRELCAEAGWRDSDATRVPPVQPEPSRPSPESPAGRSPEVTGTTADASELEPLEIGVGHLSRSLMETNLLHLEIEQTREALAGREERVAVLESAVQAHETAQHGYETQIAALNAKIGELHALRESRIAELHTEREAAIAEIHAEQNDRLGEIERETADLERRLRDETRDRQHAHREVAALQQTVADQSEHLDVSIVQAEAMISHEQELQDLLAAAHEQLIHRDSEVMGTLGAVLARHAPNAPAAIYYRQLLDHLRVMVAEHVPPTAPIIVASAGDDAMLKLRNHQAWHFPPSNGGMPTDLIPPKSSVVIAQLEMLRSRGARYLIAPNTASAWISQHPDLQRHLAETYTVVAHQPTIGSIYALGGDTDSASPETSVAPAQPTRGGAGPPNEEQRE